MIIEPIDTYDLIIISYSGGKDSTACVLELLAQGAKPQQIELWHQSIDGRLLNEKPFFDWQSTDGYVSQFAKHMNLNLSYQWRAQGFYGEMFRIEERTKDVWAERNGDLIHVPSSIHGKKSTRLKFPAKTASLSTRWCSAYLKIDVAARIMNNLPEFRGKKILFVTGERREESSARSKYKETELHRTHSSRKTVHHWRPIIDWKEQSIWDIIEANNIQPHPAYYLGFPRLSCRSCIFYSKDHWATLKEVAPDVIDMLVDVERQIGYKLDNKLTIDEMVAIGKSKLLPENYKYIDQAINEYSGEILTNNWQLPVGAFGSGGGAI